MYRLLVLALAVIWPLTAAGAFYTGKDLLDWCDGTNVGEPRDSVDLYNTCVVYLAGVIDTDETISGWGYKSGHVCPPKASPWSTCAKCGSVTPGRTRTSCVS